MTMHGIAVKHTQGPWRVGRDGGCIVADHPVPGMGGSDDVAYYGGHLIAESVIGSNAPILAAAPDLLDSVREFVAMYDGLRDSIGPTVLARLVRADAAIAKAEGR